MKIRIGDGEEREEKITCMGTTPEHFKAPDFPAKIVIDTKQTSIVLSSNEAARLVALMVPTLFKDAGKLLEHALHTYHFDEENQ